MRDFTYPPKPRPGDRVAVLSPSWAAPALYPAVFELGLRRLHSEFGLHPVEYPTTRGLGSTPKQRAADIHAAFADPDIAAVLTTIGGDDQLKVLGHLDPDVLAANPKPVVGFSDNTNLLNYLWNLGIVSYHGAAVMVQLARGGGIHPVTASLRAALFTSGGYELGSVDAYTDEELDWARSDALEAAAPMFISEPWTWHGGSTAVTGPAWGGSLEIIDFNLRANRYLLSVEEYHGAVLFIETSEELPPATYVYRVLMGMGERGLLGQFAAVLVGRPKAWSLDRPTTADEKATYTAEQYEAVLTALAEYNQSAPVVLGVDFGHTEPQFVIPNGGTVAVDPGQRVVRVTY